MSNESTARASSPPGYRRSRVRCTRCGSIELHRSRPRGTAERLVTGITPFGSYRCPACGKRALHLNRLATAEPPQDGPGTSSQGRRRRPSRTRDSLRSFSLAVGLGLGLGLLLIKTFAR